MMTATTKISMTEITDRCGHGITKCGTQVPFQINAWKAPTARPYCNPALSAGSNTAIAATVSAIRMRLFFTVAVNVPWARRAETSSPG